MDLLVLAEHGDHRVSAFVAPGPVAQFDGLAVVDQVVGVVGDVSPMTARPLSAWVSTTPDEPLELQPVASAIMLTVAVSAARDFLIFIISLISS